MIKFWIHTIFFFTVTLAGPDVSAKNNPYLQDLLNTATSLKLADSRSWRKLLFYDDRPLRQNSSMIDDKDFFLALDGHKNPNAELQQTLTSFFSHEDNTVNSSGLHPQCFYAARFDWLNEKLQFDFKRIKNIHCPGLEQYKKLSNYQGVSLVFSNYFINNPASMFGHTFFRLHKGKSDQDGLLDDAVNYAAFVEHMNIFAYPFKGLFGGYQGRFSLVPYYDKVNEYSHSESRDLWEYKLNFSPKESQKMALILWELGNTHLNYYYLSKNCSFILLAILEATNPKLQLTKEFSFLASPEATIKALYKEDQLVTHVSYRPSAFSRYTQRLKLLSSDEKQNLSGLLKKNTDHSFLKNCDSKCQAKVLDTALDFIEYKKRTVLKNNDFLKQRMRLLVLRSKNQEHPLKINANPTELDPSYGHRTSLLGISLGTNNKSHNLLDLRLRPALHDLNSSNIGYNNSMEMRFFDTKLRYNLKTERFSINTLDIIRILSLPKNYTLLTTWAWHISTGIERYRKCFSATECQRFYAQLGLGKSIHLLSEKLIAYNILNLDLGTANEAYQYTHIGPWNSFGLIFNPTNWLKFTSGYHYSIHYSKKETRRQKLTFDVNFYLKTNLDLNIQYQNELVYSETMLGLKHHF